MSNNQNTRDKGLEYVFSILSSKGWKQCIIKQGRTELFRIDKNNKSHIIQIRTLSKENAVPFPDGLDILDRIDYLVICNNLKELPKIIVLKSKTIREIIHKDPVNETAYWLEIRDYNKYGMTFEQIFE